jgi:hypothetical protein
VKRASGLLAAIAIVASCTAGPAPSASPSVSWNVGNVWRLIELPDDAKGAAVADIVATDHGLVAIGEGEFPSAWVSLDGLRWSAERLPGFGIPTDVVALDNAVVAVGRTSPVRCAHPDGEAIWVRAATGRWAAAPFRDFFCAGGSWDVISTGARAVIVGTSGMSERGFVWTSNDGLDWRDAQVPATFRPQLVASADGALVAISYPAPDAGGLWTVGRSPDGTDWAITPVTGLPLDDRLASMVSRGSGLVAWLGGANGKLQAFTSRRGDAWEPFPLVVPPGIELRSVNRVAGTYIGYGTDRLGPVLLVSSDAATWRQIPRPAAIASDGSLGKLTVSDSAVYLVGTSSSVETPRLWSADRDILAK